MKTIYKAVLAALVAAPLFTSCIEEITPTDLIIQDQLKDNPRATEALVWAMPGHLNEVGTISTSHWDIGYPGIMHIRDLFTADLRVSTLGANYNHFWYWCENSLGLGPDYLYPQYPWNWLYKHVLATNKVVQAIDDNTTNPELRMQLAAGYADRAWVYLDFARMYEVLPTDGYEVSAELLGLTLPKVTEETTEEQMRDNPRLSHDDMVAFIKSDLDKAIALSEGAASVPNKTIPGLAVMYGLYARLNLWDASYQAEINNNTTAANNLYTEAKKYADLAIATCGGTPLTRAQWLDTNTGFNTSDPSSWMFCGQYVTEDTGVQAPNVSWTGWMSSEKTYGYASTRLKAFPEIGAAVYERMSDRDWRKLSFVAPEGSALSGQEPFLDAQLAEENFTVPYISIKFRPGGGATTNGQTGCAVAYPLMRVEEMYFISIEAQAHLDVAAGKAALENFMKTYRYNTYSCVVSDAADVIEEIIFQKRVELWGEGQAFFDIKRLDYPVIRAYEGTNFTFGSETWNTTRRPAWMNLCITNQECDNNAGIPRSLNVPNPNGCYTVIKKL